jgi:hypothetical protein
MQADEREKVDRNEVNNVTWGSSNNRKYISNFAALSQFNAATCKSDDAIPTA